MLVLAVDVIGDADPEPRPGRGGVVRRELDVPSSPRPTCMTATSFYA